MKIQDFKKPLLVIAAVSVLSFLAWNVVAQDSTAPTAAPPATAQTAPQLSYGVSQVVQLEQAKVGDSTIIAYIQNSGNSYGLNANQIIYLRQQGVSDGVINTMLNQRNNSAVATAQTASPQQSSSDTSAQTSTAVAQPTVTYVQTVPTSSVYVIPDTQTYDYNAWYYSQPYYYPYYAWPYPVASFSFGFGGRWGGGGWHGGGGGWHGGGGGWHGGGGGWHR